MLQFYLLVIAALLLQAFAIYPEDHWQYSTELSTDNFDGFIKDNVDAGKTVFVRWIASEGWGWWRKQAPSWNEITKRFANNNNVAFGDVNLSKNQVRGNHSPGAGGWPTIRYFNKETGYDGASYTKKTSKAMCDELGDISYMQAYVEEAGQTSLCDVNEQSNCSSEEVTFIKKWSAKKPEAINAEATRLQVILSQGM